MAKPMPMLKRAIGPVMIWGLLCVMLSAVGVLSTRNAVRAGRSSAADITADPRVRQALAKLASEAPSVTEEQIRIAEIPAPTFRESLRGTHLAKLLADAGLKVHTDEAGNVIGERAGSAKGEFVLITAHLDTVFPAGTDVHVRRQGSKLWAPGISDNGAGLATLPVIARIMRDTKLETRSSVLFVADVGEEGEGNLRGIRKLVEEYRKQLRYVIALDGASIDYVTTAALASRRVEITISGPGGHSWSDFGVPNPIDALARGIALFLKTPPPDSPRTTFNVGSIEGGTSVNSIPAKASIKVDLRSEAEPEILKLETALRRSIQSGMDEEMQAARDHGMAGGAGLSIGTKVLGLRPGGELPPNSPLLAAVQAADDYLGNRARMERSSTDANIPLSLGIPAIALGAGGNSGGAHSLQEWYDPTGREIGMQRLLLTLLQVAGLNPPTD
ncbi:MAG TPA: M20/M25/M40 family metallo-hydrolase [Rugosimonospora sp.]|nr:M20/M25/M40 family metallo-hydrolase [Rugosimonospora sp.]